MSKDEDCSIDINNRLGKACGAFNKISKIWRLNGINTNTSIIFVNNNVISVLLYSSEERKTTEQFEGQVSRRDAYADV